MSNFQEALKKRLKEHPDSWFDGGIIVDAKISDVSLCIVCDHEDQFVTIIEITHKVLLSLHSLLPPEKDLKLILPRGLTKENE